MNYYEELECLRKHVTNNYINKSEQYEESSVEEKRRCNSRCWAAMTALEKCYDFPFEDPLDRLRDFLNDMNVELTFAKQIINKNHYSCAAEVVEELIKFIMERRK